MRTLEEVDADIAETKRQIELGNAFNRRAARFDYILEGDRSGLDAIASAVNNAVAREAQQKFQAEQNQLNRESAERMQKAAKAEADDETRDQIVKELQANTAILDDMEKDPSKYTAGQVSQQRALVSYWKKRAEKKGVQLKPEEDKGEPKGQEVSPDRKAYLDWKNMYKTVDDPKLTAEDHYRLAKELEASDYFKNEALADDVRGLMFQHYMKGDEKADADAASRIAAIKGEVESKGTPDSRLKEIVNLLDTVGKNRQGNWRPNASEYRFKAQSELNRRAKNRDWNAKVEKALKGIPEETADRAADGNHEVTAHVGKTPVFGYAYRVDGKLRIYSRKGPAGKEIKVY